MKLEYDAAVDAAHIRLTNAEVVDSEEVKPGIILDYDAQNRVVGIEILHVKKRLPEADLTHFELDVA